MAAYLFYSPGNTFDGSTGRNSVIAAGADEAAARAAAIAAAPDGETKVHADWSALQLAATEHADLVTAGGVVWLQGPAAEPLRPSRGA